MTSSLVDHIDLMADEFKRIQALNPSPEIVDLCDRALRVTQQNVPVIEQRDRLETEVNRLRVQLASDLDEKQAERVARAFWRRIYPYRNDYGKELPKDCPVEFTANMATALCALECPATASPHGDLWVKCSDRLPDITRKISRKNRNGILVRFDNGMITQFREVTELLVNNMRNGPRQPTKFETPAPARMTHWMEIHSPFQGAVVAEHD